MKGLSPEKQKVDPKSNFFKNRAQIRALTNTQKNLYCLFNIFQFKMSRLYRIPMFKQLINEIQNFNREIEDWKSDKHQIKNLITTYSLYENLSSRLKFVCNCSKDENQSMVRTQEIAQWFMSQKPKIRCQVKEVKASMRGFTPDPVQTNRIQSMAQYSQLKREMLPYEMMSRTAHPGILPPKQKLKQYKRKHFLPFEEQKRLENNPMTAKKSTSASLSKNRLSKFRQSVGTMMTTSTMNETKSTFKNTVSDFKLTQNKKDEKMDIINKDIEEEAENAEGQKDDPNNQKQVQQQLDEMQREKQAIQQTILQDNIQQNLGEDDQADQDAIYDDDQGPSKTLKLYIRDHDPQELAIAQEMSKQAQQSTLRRVMKINEDKIRSKFEELDIKRNMLNWGKIKAKNATVASRKLEANLHMNKFKQLAYQKKNMITKAEAKQFENKQKKYFNATTGFKGFKQENKEQRQAKNIVPMLYRSKSSHAASMETEIKKLRIQQVMKTYGKYINHIPIQEDDDSPEDKNANNVDENKSTFDKETEKTNFRSTSLTNFTANLNKKKQLGDLLRENNEIVYNQRADEQLFKIKKTLSSKMIYTQKADIYRAISSVPIQQTIPEFGLYTSGRDLLSNPFFPKHLYAGGKKKKKKAK